MRDPSAFSNRKHTPDSLREELVAAQRAGSPAEIADLALLIANAERPKGTPKLDGAGPAANRQAQRRYQRNRTWDQNAHNTNRRKPVIGDYMRCPDGRVYPITHIDADRYISDVAGKPYIWCHVSQLTIVDGPTAPSPAPAPTPGPDALHEACEALYQGIWDAYEVQDWAALERALRAYEARLATLGV